jgi:hypothetical protein
MTKFSLTLMCQMDVTMSFTNKRELYIILEDGEEKSSSVGM